MEDKNQGSNAGGSSSDCPTPPPRSKHSKDPRAIKKRPTFTSVHKQVGQKILADQEERWKRLSNVGI